MAEAITTKPWIPATNLLKHMFSYFNAQQNKKTNLSEEIHFHFLTGKSCFE